jgi:hypothetical protein
MPKIGGSIGSQKQYQETNPFAPVAQGFFANDVLPYTRTLLQNTDAKGGQIGQSSRDYYQRLLNGDTADLDAALNASRVNAQKMVNAGVNGANQAAQRAGMLSSGAAYRLRNRAAMDQADRFAEQEANARLRSRENAAQVGLGIGQQDVANLMQFLNLFRGGGTTYGRGNNSAIQVA